jgi:hypothetical protein
MTVSIDAIRSKRAMERFGKRLDQLVHLVRVLGVSTLKHQRGETARLLLEAWTDHTAGPMRRSLWRQVRGVPSRIGGVAPQ